MKRFFSLSIVFVFCSLASMAQHDRESREKFEAQKVAYLTTVLDLSAAEAQLFWPIYNEQQQKRKEIRKLRMAERKEAAANLESMSDKEAEALIDREMDFKQKDLDLQKELHVKLKKVISAKKIARLYKAESDFQKKVLKELDGKHKEEIK